MATTVEVVVSEDLSWDENDRNFEPTSSEDELLGASAVDEIEETTAWLDAVGLGQIADRMLEGSHLVTDVNLEKAANEEGLTKRQYHTIQRRVETLRATLKSRKNRLGGHSYHQRPDCRDIFRDCEASHSGGSSGRSRSATPDSLGSSSSRKTSTENLLLSAEVSPKSWSRSSSHDEDIINDKSLVTDNFALGNLDVTNDGSVPPPIASDLLINGQILLETRARLDPQRRRSLTQAERSVTFINVRPNLQGFFNPLGDSPVAKADKNVEIVKYKSLGTLPLCHGRRNSSDPYEDSSSAYPLLKELPKTLEDGLSTNQIRKIRQLAFLEYTSIMDENDLPVRKRSRLQSVRNFAHSTRERQVFGVNLKKLTERDQAQTPVILEMIIEQIRSKHLEEEGLLRVPGNKQKTASLQKLVESNSKSYYESKGSGTVWKAFESAGPHELCSLLKQFLRQLPESLFTQDRIELFAQVADLKKADEQLKALNLLIIQLPEPYYYTLRSLLKFLMCIVDHQASNRMTLNNVATVMGPCLFPPRISKSTKLSSIGDELLYTAKTNRIMELLLLHQHELFLIPLNIYSQLKFVK